MLTSRPVASYSRSGVPLRRIGILARFGRFRVASHGVATPRREAQASLVKLLDRRRHLKHEILTGSSFRNWPRKSCPLSIRHASVKHVSDQPGAPKGECQARQRRPLRNTTRGSSGSVGIGAALAARRRIVATVIRIILTCRLAYSYLQLSEPRHEGMGIVAAPARPVARSPGVTTPLGQIGLGLG